MKRKNTHVIVFAVIATALAAVVIISAHSWVSVRKAFSELNATAIPVLDHASELSLDISQARTEIFRYVNKYEPSPYRIQKHINQIRSNLLWISRHQLPRDSKDLVAALMVHTDQFQQTLNLLEANMRKGDSISVLLTANMLKGSDTTLLFSSGKLRDNLWNHIISENKASQQKILRDNVLLSFISLVLIMMMVCGVLFQNHVLQRQVQDRTVELQDRLHDLHQSERVLQESEKFLAAIVENIPDMIFVKDAKELRFVRLNRAGEDLLGYSRDDMIGKNDHDFFPKKEADFFTKKDREVLDRGLLLDIPEEPIQTKLKGERTLHTKKLPIMDKNGHPAYLLGISNDITDYKQLEEQLRQTQKMESIGNLAGGIAHDFNNILFPIIGMSEMLLEDLPAVSLEYENAQEILKAGKRGRNLVKQILEFSRQSKHQMIPVRMQTVLNEVLMLIRSTIPADIEISQNIDADCGRIMADPTQMHQIAMNLITNAYHAVETSGGKFSVDLNEIEIKAEESIGKPVVPGRYALLTVSDNGCGIDPAIMNKIFEPYFTTKEQGKGTGLGLAVVYGIVKEHNGDIKAYSEMGKGTSFHAYFPLIDKIVASVPIDKAPTHQTGDEHILLVDDEEVVAGLEKQMLERLGYRVTVRTSSPDALKAFTANPSAFDLVVSDMTMPNMTGDLLARELIAVRPDIPIIICTGFSERINQDNAATVGVKGFMMKPIVKSEMAKMVRKVLSEAKSKTQ